MRNKERVTLEIRSEELTKRLAQGIREGIGDGWTNELATSKATLAVLIDIHSMLTVMLDREDE